MDLLLVGGFNHLEKYEFVNGKDDIPYIMEHKKWLKPPTRYVKYGFAESIAVTFAETMNNGSVLSDIVVIPGTGTSLSLSFQFYIHSEVDHITITPFQLPMFIHQKG